MSTDETERPLPNVNGFDTVTVDLFLNDLKVYRRFGDRLPQGIALPFAHVKREAGMIYKARVVINKKGEPVILGGGGFRPNPIRKKLTMVGVRLKPGLWRVTLPASVAEQAQGWLLTLCGVDAEPLHVNRPKPHHGARLMRQGK